MAEQAVDKQRFSGDLLEHNFSYVFGKNAALLMGSVMTDKDEVVSSNLTRPTSKH